MVSQDVCNTDLSLSGFINHKPDQTQQNRKHSLLSLKYDHVFPSLSLGLLSSEEKGQNLYREASSLSGVSSYSNSSVKREREINGEEFEVERESPRVQMNDIDQDDEGSVRKKLRLTKQQSIILEDSFKEHTTLNPKQKVDLAKELNLRPRQVEVWFQNRRARTKLKQTEVEYELLKKCCETLTDENKRLEKELQELKAMNKTAPFYLQLPTATLTMCPSCQRIGGSNEISGKSRFPNIGATPPFYNPFTHPSAAC